jgi:predicted dehydrogenase
MSKQRIAFVGCGGIADHYLEVYRDLEWIKVVTCVDASLDRALRAAERIGKGAHTPRATTKFEDALGEDVDTVVINTPNHLHREQAAAALEAGKHVLLQKPLAATLADAGVIAKAAAQAAQRGIISGLYLSYFDQPLMHDLRDMMRCGWFGDIAHLYARLMHRGGLVLSRQIRDGQKNWRASAAQTGGGCFIQLAVHYIHLFAWMMDASVVRVTAVSRNLHCPGVEGEDLACAILEFDNGALATLNTAWCAAGEQLAVQGTRGTAEYIGNQTLMLDSDAGQFTGRVINFTGGSVSSVPGAPGASVTQQVNTVHAPRLDDLSNPYNQHRLFLEAVRENHPPPVSIASGVEDMRVVAAVYESMKTGRAISVSEPTLKQ